MEASQRSEEKQEEAKCPFEIEGPRGTGTSACAEGAAASAFVVAGVLRFRLALGPGTRLTTSTPLGEYRRLTGRKPTGIRSRTRALKPPFFRSPKAWEEAREQSAQGRGRYPAPPAGVQRPLGVQEAGSVPATYRLAHRLALPRRPTLALAFPWARRRPWRRPWRRPGWRPWRRPGWRPWPWPWRRP